MQEKVQKMMDLLKSAKFNVITIDGKILLTIKIEDKEHSFTLNWDGDEDYWRTIEIGKYFYDVNVWLLPLVLGETSVRRIVLFPVIDGETVSDSKLVIHRQVIQKESEQFPNGLPPKKTNLQTAIEILEKHNEWRKGGEGEETDPKQLTWALDLIISNFKQK